MRLENDLSNLTWKAMVELPKLISGDAWERQTTGGVVLSGEEKVNVDNFFIEVLLWEVKRWCMESNYILRAGVDVLQDFVMGAVEETWHKS